MPDCPEAVKVEKEKNSYLLCGKNRAGREEICHALMDDFVNHGNLSFQNFSKYASFLLIPVEDFLVLSERFSPFSSNNRKREKTRGRRENFFRMKKRLPNLSSAIILLLLSYLAQSPTGRCQSGRMSTPGKCVYRKPVPRVRIPPCPPSIFHRNIFVMDILRFLFAGVWGKYWENE